MQTKRRLAGWHTVIVLLLMVGALFSVEIAPAYGAGSQSQLAQGSRTPRRATIRRSPSRRTLKVQSVVATGTVPLVPCQFPLNTVVEPNTAGMPASVVAIPPEDPFQVRLGQETYLPDAPKVQHYFYAIPMICTATQPSADQAYAVSPDGERLPALILPTRSGASPYLVTLPLTAYVQPGVWQLVIDDGGRYAVDVIVPPIDAPTVVFGGEDLLLAGYKPGEWVKVVLFALTDPDYAYAGEVDVLADDDGSVLLARPELAVSYGALVLGEQSEGYASDFPVTAIVLEPAEPGTPATQARSAAQAPAADASAPAVYEADTFFTDMAREFFFQADERPPADDDQQPEDADAPDGLPPTGMARVTPLTSALLVSLILLTAAGAAFVVYRRR